MRLFDPLTKILPITQIELIPNGRPTMPATPHPTDPAFLDRDQPVVPLIRDVVSPDVGESPVAINDTELLPTPIGIDRRPGHQVGEELMPERCVPVRFEKNPRLLRRLFTDPGRDRRYSREIEIPSRSPQIPVRRSRSFRISQQAHHGRSRHGLSGPRGSVGVTRRTPCRLNNGWRSTGAMCQERPPSRKRMQSRKISSGLWVIDSLS